MRPRRSILQIGEATCIESAIWPPALKIRRGSFRLLSEVGNYFSAVIFCTDFMLNANTAFEMLASSSEFDLDSPRVIYHFLF